jgi:hypothetical protein
LPDRVSQENETMPNVTRLETLRGHLRCGELAHEKFDFSVFNKGHARCEPPVPGCGYAGCAIGECPALFPDDWEFVLVDPEDDVYTPQLRNSQRERRVGMFPVIDDAAEFFDLTRRCADALFIGERYYRIYDLGLELGGQDWEATRYDVAAEIDVYLAWVDDMCETLAR